MSESSLPVFVDEAPEIEVKNDHFYVKGNAVWAWTAPAFREFVESARLALLAYDENNRKVIRLGRRKR